MPEMSVLISMKHLQRLELLRDAPKFIFVIPKFTKNRVMLSIDSNVMKYIMRNKVAYLVRAQQSYPEPLF